MNKSLKKGLNNWKICSKVKKKRKKDWKIKDLVKEVVVVVLVCNKDVFLEALSPYGPNHLLLNGLLT